MHPARPPAPTRAHRCLPLAATLFAAGLATLPAAPAFAQAAAPAFNIPAGPLDTALDRFARAAGVNLAYDTALVQGLSTRGLSGTFAVPQGLATLLAGTGLEAVPQPTGGFALRRGAPQPVPAAVPAARSVSLEEVTVLGSRDPNVSLSNVPASISVVPREEIDRQRPTAQRIEDVLTRTVPGFNPTNNGVRQIRGRTAQVFVNGVPTNEQLRASSGSDINLVAPDQLEVIEVARGANSAYGFGSPGGIIALSTPRAESEDLTLTSRVSTSFNTSTPGGSFQTSLYQAAARIVGDFDYHVGLSLRQDDLVRDPQGRPALDYNSPAMFSMGKEGLYDFDTSLGHKLGGGALRFTATAGRADVDERYESDDSGTYREVDSRLARQPAGDRNTRRSYTVNLGYEHPDIAGSAVRIEALASRVHTMQYSELAGVIRRDDQTNQYAGVRTAVTTPLDTWQQGATASWGLDYMRNRYFRPLVDDATGAVLRYYSPDVTLESWAPYLQGQVPVGNWRFNGGLRHERYAGSVETGVGIGGIQGGDLRSFSLTLFNAGAVYTLQPGQEVYASFSQGAEISQVGRAATTAGTADRVDPQPAKSDQYELGFRQRQQDLGYSLAAFYTTSDLMSALECNIPNEPCRPLREPRKFWGVEGTLGWRLDPRWGLGGTFSWMDGRRTLSTGEERSIGSNETPPLQVNAYVDYAPQANWRNRLQLQWRGSRDPFDGPPAYPEGPVDSVFLAHFSLGFDVGPGELQFGIRNLFDKRYYSVVAEAYAGSFNWIPEQGRRISIAYAAKW